MATIGNTSSQAGQAQVVKPAFVANNPQGTTLDSTSNANLPIFTNPVAGNVDTGVSHEGDLGGAG